MQHPWSDGPVKHVWMCRRQASAGNALTAAALPGGQQPCEGSSNLLTHLFRFQAASAAVLLRTRGRTACQRLGGWSAWFHMPAAARTAPWRRGPATPALEWVVGMQVGYAVNSVAAAGQERNAAAKLPFRVWPAHIGTTDCATVPSCATMPSCATYNAGLRT